MGLKVSDIQSLEDWPVYGDTGFVESIDEPGAWEVTLSRKDQWEGFLVPSFDRVSAFSFEFKVSPESINDIIVHKVGREYHEGEPTVTTEWQTYTYDMPVAISDCFVAVVFARTEDNTVPSKCYIRNVEIKNEYIFHHKIDSLSDVTILSNSKTTYKGKAALNKSLGLEDSSSAEYPRLVGHSIAEAILAMESNPENPRIERTIEQGRRLPHFSARSGSMTATEDGNAHDEYVHWDIEEVVAIFDYPGVKTIRYSSYLRNQNNNYLNFFKIYGITKFGEEVLVHEYIPEEDGSKISRNGILVDFQEEFDKVKLVFSGPTVENYMLKIFDLSIVGKNDTLAVLTERLSKHVSGWDIEKDGYIIDEFPTLFHKYGKEEVRLLSLKSKDGSFYYVSGNDETTDVERDFPDRSYLETQVGKKEKIIVGTNVFVKGTPAIEGFSSKAVLRDGVIYLIEEYQSPNAVQDISLSVGAMLEGKVEVRITGPHIETVSGVTNNRSFHMHINDEDPIYVIADHKWREYDFHNSEDNKIRFTGIAYEARYHLEAKITGLVPKLELPAPKNPALDNLLNKEEEVRVASVPVLTRTNDLGEFTVSGTNRYRYTPGYHDTGVRKLIVTNAPKAKVIIRVHTYWSQSNFWQKAYVNGVEYFVPYGYVRYGDDAIFEVEIDSVSGEIELAVESYVSGSSYVEFEIVAEKYVEEAEVLPAELANKGYFSAAGDLFFKDVEADAVINLGVKAEDFAVYTPVVEEVPEAMANYVQSLGITIVDGYIYKDGVDTWYKEEDMKSFLSPDLYPLSPWRLLHQFASASNVAPYPDTKDFSGSVEPINSISEMSDAGITYYLFRLEENYYHKEEGYMQVLNYSSREAYLDIPLPAGAIKVKVEYGNWYNKTVSLSIGGIVVDTLSANHGAAEYAGSYSEGDTLRITSGVGTPLWIKSIWVSRV